jgi:hypothetical protein
MLFTVNLTRILILTKNARGPGNGATFGCRPDSAATLWASGIAAEDLATDIVVDEVLANGRMSSNQSGEGDIYDQ